MSQTPDSPLQGWVLDPEDPRAPSDSQWAAMTEAEREQVVASLPIDYESSPPEGDLHTDAFVEARSTLRRWFRQQGKRLYVAGQMNVYYPQERVFSPDIYAVLDVADQDRNVWSVQKEGKGLDFALEIHVHGDWKKDFQSNVVRYARLGIREYFAHDVLGRRLVAYVLSEEGARYLPRLPQAARFHSDVLGLQLYLEGGRLRFSVNGADIPGADDMLRKLQTLADEGMARAEALAAALAEAQLGREEEQRRREEAERRVALLEAELARRDGGGESPS